jgi:uncharacterized membrane protein YiaA
MLFFTRSNTLANIIRIPWEYTYYFYVVILELLLLLTLVVYQWISDNITDHDSTSIHVYMNFYLTIYIIGMLAVKCLSITLTG